MTNRLTWPGAGAPTRLCAWLLPLLLAACGGGGGAPEPRARTVTVTPGDVAVQPGEVVHFQARVLGQGDFSPEVTWSLSTVPLGVAGSGTIAADGTYQAPDVVVAATVLVTARSVTTPSASATVAVSLPPRAFRLEPSEVEVSVGQSVQLQAVVSGLADRRVTWETSAPGSPLDQDGRFTAILMHSGGWFQVLATSAAGDLAVGTVRVAAAPVELLGTSGPAAPGEVMELYTQGTDWPGRFVVEFTPAAGEPLLRSAWPLPGGSVLGSTLPVLVPLGAATGEIRIVEPVQSTATPFVRAPLLRLRPQRQALAAGQSTPLDLAFLGAPRVPVTFEADVGEVVGSTYQAPANVAETTFATVRACQAGGIRCTTATIALHPFLVGPEPLLVRAGEALQLVAETGAGSLQATFTLLNGAGSCTADGLCRASADVAQAGPLKVQVDTPLGRQVVELGVTGLVPGLVGRLVELVDERTDVPAGTARGGSWAETVATSGTRAYVAAGPPEATWCLPGECAYPPPDGTPSTWWIDTYDLSDPLRPRWLGAVESATRPESMFIRGERLVVWTATDPQAEGRGPLNGTIGPGFGTLAVYDLGGPLPVLVDREVSPSGDAASLAGEGTLARIGKPDLYGSAFRVRFSDLAGDPLQTSREILVPLPAGCNVRYAASDGARLYGRIACFPDGPEITHRVTWDLQAEPPALLEDVEDSQLRGRFSVEGSFLFERLNWMVHVYDLTRGLAEPIAELKAGSPLPPLPTGDGRFLFGGGFALGPVSGVGLTLVDLSVPTLAAPISTTSSGASARTGMALLANSTALVAEGRAGVGVYDLSPRGGALPVERLMYPDLMCTGIGSSGLVVGEWVYGAGTGLFAQFGGCGEGGVQPFLVAWDFSAPGRPRTSQQIFPWESFTAELAAWPGGLLLVTEQGLDLFSLAIPSEPAWISGLDLVGRSVAVDGGVAWVGTWGGDLVAISLESPEQPLVLGALPLGLPPSAIVPLGGGLLAVGLGLDGVGELVVVDGSAPTAPRLVGRASLATEVNGLDVEGSLAALATAEGLVVVDLADPARPALLASVALPTTTPFGEYRRLPTPWRVRFQGGLAWVGTSDMTTRDEIYSGGAVVHGYDLSVPAWPQLVASAHPPIALQIEALVPKGRELISLGKMDTVFDVSQPRNVVRELAGPWALAR